MSYKFSTGSIRRGDIYYEDDRVGEATFIDFGQDTITLRPSGAAVLYAQHNRDGVGTTSPDYTFSGNKNILNCFTYQGECRAAGPPGLLSHIDVT